MSRVASTWEGDTRSVATPIDFLHRLVAIRSQSGEEAEAVRMLVLEMAARGFDAFVDGAGNGIGIRGSGSRQLMLLGHIDTVPGGPAVTRRDGLLYGRGTVDAKGPLAAFVVAAASVTLPSDWQLVVVGAVEEESASSRGARHLLDRYRPDGVIVGEPSGWSAITIGYKGRLLCDFEVREPMAHTAGPGNGVAAEAFYLWNRIEAYVRSFNQSEGREPIFMRLQPSIRSIQTFTEDDEDGVRATFGFRLPPQLLPGELVETIRGLAPEAATLRFRGGEPAWQSSRSDPMARAFNGALREQGVVPRFKVKTGTSDANVVSPHWKCPMVAYGAGDSTLDHTPQEHLSLHEWTRSIEVLKQAIERFTR